MAALSLVQASRAALDDRVPPSFAASGRQDLNLRPLDRPLTPGLEAKRFCTSARCEHDGRRDACARRAMSTATCGPALVPSSPPTSDGRPAAVPARANRLTSI